MARRPGWVKVATGGPDAELDVAEGVMRLQESLQRMGPQDSGSFFDLDGGLIP